MSPTLHYRDELPDDVPFTGRHGQHAMAEELLKVLHIAPGRYPEHPFASATPARDNSMQMGMIPVELFTKDLCGHDGT